MTTKKDAAPATRPRRSGGVADQSRLRIGMPGTLTSRQWRHLLVVPGFASLYDLHDYRCKNIGKHGKSRAFCAATLSGGDWNLTKPAYHAGALRIALARLQLG